MACVYGRNLLMCTEETYVYGKSNRFYSKDVPDPFTMRIYHPRLSSLIDKARA